MNPSSARTLRTATTGVFCALAALAAATPVAAAPIATDRPTFSYGSAALLQGEIQLESGLSYTDATIDPITPTFRFGIRDHLELRLAGPTVIQGDADGRIVPLEIGAKWAFLTDGRFTSAVLAHLLADISERVPADDDRFGALGVYAWGFGLGDCMSLGGNVAARFDEVFSASASLAATFSIAGGVSAFAESWVTATEGDGLLNADIGVLWVPRDPVQVDAFVGNLDLTGLGIWHYGLGLSLRVDTPASRASAALARQRMVGGG